MNRGYVKIYRKTLDSGFLRNHNAWILFSYCLLKATHKEYKAIVGNQEVYLKPGQLIFGRRLAAEETGLSERQIRTALVFLQNVQIVTSKPTNKFSIISIVNWETYQSPEPDTDQQNDQHATSNRPHTRTKEHKNNLSVELYNFYLSEIVPAEKTKKRAESNIKSHLHNHSPDDLKQAISNYKTVAAKRDPQYRKNPANFFGKRESAFIDYLPENFQANNAGVHEAPETQRTRFFSANDPESIERLYSNE